jgi:hypothetical protein
MTAAMKRNRLITYLVDADEKKVKALYALLEEDINEHTISHVFTEHQLEIIEDRRTELLSGADKGTKWQTIHNNIRQKRDSVK